MQRNMKTRTLSMPLWFPFFFLLRHFLDDRNTHILGYSNQKQIDLLGDSGRRIQKIIERQLTAWR